jgi:hypothetical protein
MSASQEKKKRIREREEGVEKKQVKRASMAKIKKRNNLIKTVVGIVVALVIVCLIIFNSTLFYSGVSALKIGDHSYTAAEFNYYYQTAYFTTYQNIYSTYGQYASMLLDTSKPLKAQQYSEDQTWDDFFKEAALNNMKQCAALNDAAKAEGYTISADAKASIDASIQQARDEAVSNGYGSFEKYLIAIYGKGFSEELFNKCVSEMSLASDYSNALTARYEYTDEQLSEKYDSVSADYDLTTYCSYYASGAADDEAGLDADTAMNKAYSVAQAISAAKTEDIFAELVLDNCSEDEKAVYADASSVLHKNVAPASLPADCKEWLTSADRVYGDSTFIESGTGYYALLYVGRNHNDYKLQSFRHILVKAIPDGENGEISASALQTAQSKANDIYTTWQTNPTEENFASLADEYTDDTGSAGKGGLYTDNKLGALVPEIENWLFSGENKPGDTSIIYVKSSSYSGYHIVYYVGEGEQYNLQLADNLLRNDDFSAWLENLESSYEVKKLFAYSFTK